MFITYPIYNNGIEYGCYGLISVFLKVPDELKTGMKTLKELRRRNVKIVEGPELKKVSDVLLFISLSYNNLPASLRFV